MDGLCADWVLFGLMATGEQADEVAEHAGGRNALRRTRATRPMTGRSRSSPLAQASAAECVAAREERAPPVLINEIPLHGLA